MGWLGSINISTPMKTDTYVWQKRPGKPWRCATIPLTHAEAVAHAKVCRRAYLTTARWRVSKKMPRA